MLLDIAFGIFIAVLWDTLGFMPLTELSVAVGILFALLPDLDGLVSAIGRLHARKNLTDEYSHEHREIFHHPIPYIVFGSVVIALITQSPAIVATFAILSLFHFAHDSIGIGWGLRWGSPWSLTAYKWFSSQDGDFGCAIARWSPKEQHAVASKKGDPNWIKNIYMRPSAVSVIETGGFVAVLILLWWYW